MKITTDYFKNFPTRLCVLLCLIVLILPFVIKSDASGRQRRAIFSASGENSGLVFRLSEALDEPQRQAQPQIARPETEPLSDEGVQNLLKRLPPIKIEGADEKDFALRDRSLPAPRTGQTISEAFPPAGSANPPEQTPSGPLEILRVSPEGEVPISPHLSVTFSQPMVAVTSNEDLSASQVPVKLSPQPQGKWRWLGTKTLLFEPAARFPMATNYTAEIPAGTKSATGGALGAAKRWTFSTPPLQVKSSYPTSGPHPRNPLFFIEFDQRIEPDALLKKIRLSAYDRLWRLRLATAEEIAADEIVNRMVKAADKNCQSCWIAFRAVARSGDDPQKPLLTGATYTYTVESGAPSAEGPRVTTRGQSFQFSTYGPLMVKSHRCNYDDACAPGMPWVIEFNNQLDVKAFDKAQIRVQPELPGMKVSNYGNWMNIEGQSKGRTVYTVTLDASIRDIYGQTLGESKTLSFRVGDATPNLAATAEGLTVLDPYSQPNFSVFSVNHEQLKVSLYAVGPEHWSQYTAFMREAQQYGYRRGQRGRVMPPIGRLISSKVIDVAKKQDELAETPVALKPALNEGLGHVIVSVEAVQPPRSEWERRSLQVWVQATNIGLDAFVGQTNLTGWASSLKDGKPLNNIELAVADYRAVQQSSARTARNGLANIPLENRGGKKMLIARNGKDVAFLPEDFGWWDDGNHSGWQKQAAGDALRWHVFDDRGMYRPGEEVHVKGWLRDVGMGPKGDVTMAAGATGVNYTLRDSRGNEILKGSAQLNAVSGFDAAFKLPATMNLGHAYLTLSATGVAYNQHQHLVRVQEFRRPEYEVKAAASEGPHFVRGHATLTAAANYYAGGGLANSEVQWHVTATPASFTPPNRGDFTFGKWTPWWEYRGQDYGVNNSKEFAGRTDASGKHRLRIDFDSVTPPRATSVNATANVQDVNRQSVGSSVNFLVHPADLYVGLRTQRWFVQKGEPLVVESIVTDLDGKAVANREIRMRAALLDWVYDKGEWKEQETSPQECVIKSGANATQCRFETREGGRYRITARIHDDRERPNESELTLWGAGGKQPPQRDLAQEKVELIPGGKEYRPGDTAEILVQSPFFPAEGVLTLRRSGLVTSEQFTMNSASHTLKIPIKEEYLPNIHVRVDLAGASSRTDDEGKPDPKVPKRPAFASGTINLSIPPTTRKLTVATTPRDKEIEPGGETTVDVELRDATGEPVRSAEVALVVVDESVLALSGYKLADPLNTFYFQRGDDVSNHHLRERVQLAKADVLISQVGGGVPGGVAAGVAGGVPGPPPPMTTPLPRMARKAKAESADAQLMAFGEEREQKAEESIRARIDFNALAFFAASLPTDANGRASVKVKLPDNLTRYRVMAVAVAGEKQFGIGESAITARLPIMARPSAPRFLNFGDNIELPVVVQNQTDQPMQVDVAVRAANAEFVVPPSGGIGSVNQPLPPRRSTTNGLRVTVPANDRVEIRFPATTTKPGTARFQIAAASGKWADAAEISLPVWTPATTEAFATYGEVDAGAIIQPVKAPSDAFKQFGGLEVTTSSTQLQALTDAVIYLTSYPYECAEQISSRVLAIAALRDVLAAFDAKGLPNADELVAAVDRDIKRLQGMQSPNGGFGFWRRDSETWPYLSIHVAHALQRAKEKGFNAPPETLERSKQYLRAIEQHIPHWYSAESRRSLIAYSLYVRNRMGDRDASKLQAGARSLIDSAGGVEKTPLEALGWLMPVLSGDANTLVAIRRHLNNRAEETAGAAHFTTSYSDGAQVLLHSDRRADGIILESLIGDSPKSDLIPKIVRGLLGHRKAGRWENTQENCFVLLALDRYFAVYEKATPDFVARVWLGAAFAGGHEFRGRTTDRHQVNVPMGYLMSQNGAQNLILNKEGAGRLYYRIGMNYAPTSLQLKPADYGFTVRRVYEAVDNPNDVRRQEDGTWRIKAGAQVRVRLTMVATARRYHVALVDPLPAGFETLNPELAITGHIPRDPNDQTSNDWRRYWWRQWFEHQNMRDERVEAFTSLLWEGVYNYSYVARATTPGVFVVPPSKAEEMYHPETFGRSGSDRVVIE